MGIEKKYWVYGLFNAKIFVRECKYSEYKSTYRILRSCDDFNGKLDILDNFVENLSRRDKRHARYLYTQLEISKWGFESSYSLALHCVISNQLSKKQDSAVMCLNIKGLIPSLFNNNVSNATIEVLRKSEFAKKFRIEILNGSINYFSDYRYIQLAGLDDQVILLNHPNFVEFLHLCEIETAPLRQIILLCNFLKNFNPLILFLKKIVTNTKFNLKTNYQNIYLSTFLESCNYFQLEEFFISQSFDIEFFYTELNIIEKKRVTNLVLISGSNQITISIQKIKPVLKWLICPILFIYFSISIVNIIKKNYHHSTDYISPPFATISGPFRLSLPNEFSESSSFMPEQNYLSKKFTTNQVLSKLLPCSSLKTIETSIEVTESSQISVFSNPGASTTIADLDLVDAGLSTDSVAINLGINTPRRSTDSTEVNENTLVTSSTQKLISGKLIKKKNLLARAVASDPIDNLLVDGSEQYISRSPAFGKRIIRKKLKSSTLEKLKWNNGDVYLYFYPNHTGFYDRITFAGNDGVCSEFKAFNTKFTAEYVNKSKTIYKYMGFTFEHTLPYSWLNTVGVSNTPRSGAGDTLRGPLISYTTNVHMSKTNVRLDGIFKNTDSNVFTKDANLLEMMFKFSEDHVDDGLNRITEKWQFELKQERTKILREDFNKNKNKTSFTNLTENQRYDRAVPDLIKYIKQKINESSERGSIFQQEPLISIFRQSYSNSLPYSLTAIANWCEIKGITLNEGAGYFSILQVLSKSNALVNTNYFLKDYSTSGKHACPYEVSSSVGETLSVRNRAVMEGAEHLKANSPDNQALHALLNTDIANAKSLSQSFINKVKIHYQNAYKAFQKDELKFVDKNGAEILSDVTSKDSYFQEWHQNIQNFQNKIDDMNQFKEPGFTPASTHTLIFDENNLDTGNPNVRDFLKPVKVTRYVKPFFSIAKGCTLEDLEQLRNSNSVSITTNQSINPENYVQ